MDMRDKTELTYDEVSLHINNCFNSRVSEMMHTAINEEIKRQKDLQNHDGYYGA